MKIRFQKGLIPLVFFMTLFGYEKELLWGYMAALMHEFAHLGVSICLKCTPVAITFGVCAMNLETQRVTNTNKHMKILATGPLFSFMMFGALFCLRKTGFLDVRLFEFANLCIFFANLFPATPLDGGRILKLCLMSHFGVIYGAKIMKAITLSMISLVMCANALLFLFGVPNPFLFIFLSFLVFSLFREKREDMYLKNLVFSGELPYETKIKFISFESDRRLIDVTSRISPSYYLMGLVFDKERFMGEISQKEIPSALKAMGAMAEAGEYVRQKKINAIEKSRDLLYNK